MTQAVWAPVVGSSVGRFSSAARSRAPQAARDAALYPIVPPHSFLESKAPADAVTCQP